MVHQAVLGLTLQHPRQLQLRRENALPAQTRPTGGGNQLEPVPHPPSGGGRDQAQVPLIHAMKEWFQFWLQWGQGTVSKEASLEP